MKPDIRSCAVLTPEILHTAPYWAVVMNDGLLVRSNVAWVEIGGRPVTTFPPNFGCYPCEYSTNTGIPTPIPWPIQAWEEEIEDWRGISCEYTPHFCYPSGIMHHCYWQIDTVPALSRVFAKRSVNDPFGTDVRPAPRRNGDSIVWVWERNT